MLGGRSTRCEGRTRRRYLGLALVGTTLFGGAVFFVFITGQGQHQEHHPSGLPLSDAPPTATTVFDSTQPLPRQGSTATEGYGGAETISAAEERAARIATEASPGPRPPSLRKASRKAVEGAQDRNGTDRVRVYVYDGVPELDFSGLIGCYRERNHGMPPWQDEVADMAQDMGEVWLHRGVLSHPWRVLDPEQADLFYVPMYPVLSFKVELGEDSPFAANNWTRTKDNRCEGLTHTSRMDAAVEYLSLSSPFFNRFGGADHVVVCAWWNCRVAIGSWHRMVLRRTVIGINEKVYNWHRWGCGPDGAVTVPYTASSVLTSSDMIGGRPPEKRDISFFFVGTARNRPERMNLDVVRNISENSVILLGGNGRDWGMNSTVYAEHMARSRFCFCPRGDTATSRRIFDALAAGCIPIVTETEWRKLPYVGTGLNYSEFAIVVGPTAFSTREEVTSSAADVMAMSDIELAKLREEWRTGMESLVYGMTTGANVRDMHPFLGTTSNFLKAVYEHVGGRETTEDINFWDCPETNLPEKKLDQRTKANLPPEPWHRRRWLSESETIINKERSLLFCAPPNAGSLQFRMLAKRMQGLSHWSVADDWPLLFDPEASELELLDITDGPLMKQIYSDNGSGWIKIAVVRDPVTRVLSAYLDIVRAWRAGLQHLEQEQEPRSAPSSPAIEISNFSTQQEPAGDDRRRWLRQAEGNTTGMQHDQSDRAKPPLGFTSTNREWVLLDAIRERRRRKEHGHRARSENKDVSAKNTHGQGSEDGDSGPFSWEGWDGAARRLAGGEGSQDSSDTAGDAGDEFFRDDGVRIPTFVEVVDALKDEPWKAPTAFRSAASLCGQLESPFDSVIPFERLQNTSTEVLKSLPGDIWGSFGASGWGPDGKHAFMAFDYGGVAWRKSAGVHAGGAQREDTGRDEDPPLPRRANDLFEGESCEWATYYGGMETLEAIGKLYAVDYNQFRWYQLDPWRERLEGCISRRNR
eukprot:g9923.t1